MIELLRRVHANLSERVPPLAAELAELADLDETSDLAPEDKAKAERDLSSVGGAR